MNSVIDFGRKDFECLAVLVFRFLYPPLRSVCLQPYPLCSGCVESFMISNILFVLYGLVFRFLYPALRLVCLQPYPLCSGCVESFMISNILFVLYGLVFRFLYPTLRSVCLQPYPLCSGCVESFMISNILFVVRRWNNVQFLLRFTYYPPPPLAPLIFVLFCLSCMFLSCFLMLPLQQMRTKHKTLMIIEE